MAREPAIRSKSLHSDDATPHLDLWQAGMIPTDLAPESSDGESLDPNLDRSGVPFPDDQAKEEQVPMSVVSSGKEDHVTEVSQDSKTIPDHIQTVDKANMALAAAEIKMTSLRERHDRELSQQLVSLLKKDERLLKKDE